MATGIFMQDYDTYSRLAFFSSCLAARHGKMPCDPTSTGEEATMTEQLEQRIYELVRRYDGVYLFKQKTLTPQIDIDSDLNFERDEAAALMEEFFSEFAVDRANFAIETYYPDEPSLAQILNPFNKREVPVVPDFTLGMLITSAQAGRWLFE